MIEHESEGVLFRDAGVCGEKLPSDYDLLFTTR